MRAFFRRLLQRLFLANSTFCALKLDWNNILDTLYWNAWIDQSHWAPLWSCQLRVYHESVNISVLVLLGRTQPVLSLSW